MTSDSLGGTDALKAHSKSAAAPTEQEMTALLSLRPSASSSTTKQKTVPSIATRMARVGCSVAQDICTKNYGSTGM